jgi:hypothetical protein
MSMGAGESVTVFGRDFHIIRTPAPLLQPWLSLSHFQLRLPLGTMELSLLVLRALNFNPGFCFIPHRELKALLRKQKTPSLENEASLGRARNDASTAIWCFVPGIHRHRSLSLSD